MKNSGVINIAPVPAIAPALTPAPAPALAPAPAIAPALTPAPALDPALITFINIYSVERGEAVIFVRCSQAAAIVPGQLPVGGVGEAVQEGDDDPCHPVHNVGGHMGLVVLGVRVQLDHHGSGESAEEVGDKDADDGPGHLLLPPVLLLLPGERCDW